MSSSRQLAAIMFTDIVGYTALMGKDEQKAFELLHKNREIHKPLIKQFDGNWIKELGDGVLASFSNATDAVLCAAALHRASGAEEFRLRIGIHLGEVIFEDNDVFGDGVNIASRIQTAAKPGAIYISESVQRNISNKRDITTQFVKQEKLKNVKESIKIYEVLIESNKPLISHSSMHDSSTGDISDKSIAVLPFVNMSNDPEQEYFSDGVTEDIIAHLSKIRELKVISRTSVIQYKRTQKSLRAISSELRVKYLLEGSVRKSGNRLRIVAQLIDARKDEHIWAETYDREMTDVFAIQTEIAENVATGLKTTLNTNERKRIVSKPTENLQAYNYYLLGRSHYHKATPTDFDLAIDYYKKAIVLDSTFALAIAALAVAHLYRGAGYWGLRPNVAMPEVYEYAQMAIELDPDLSDAYVARAEVYDWFYYDWEKAAEDYLRAIYLNPSNASAHLYLAIHLVARRKYNAAIAERQLAYELDPNSILIRLNGILVQMSGGGCQPSLEEASLLVKLEPTHFGAWFLLGLTASQLGPSEESVSAFRQSNELSHGQTFTKIMLAYGLARAGKKEEAEIVLSEIHKLEKTEFVWPMGIALAYAHLGETMKALDYLELSYEERVGWMLLIGCDPSFDILRKEARFKAVLRKIGPLEAIAEIDKFG